ncbi:MAG: M48 family metalloprotease [Armatimonadota bacterium]
MARRARRKPKKEKETKLLLSDYQFPGEKRAYWQGIGLTIGLFVWLAFMVWVFKDNIFGPTLYGSGGLFGLNWQFWWIEFVLLAYPWMTIFVANILATRHSAKDIKKTGKQRKVMPNNFSEIYRTLSRLTKLGGLKKQPNMYLLEDDAAYIYAIAGGPGTIVASTGLRDGLEDDEFEAQLAHQVGRIKSRHVRTELALQYVQNANTIFQVLLFPVWMIKLFSAGWDDITEFTADRFAILMMNSSSVLNKALVKKAALQNPEADITTEELQAYLDSTGDISTDADQMQRHFRLGNFISQQPNLQERVEANREFLMEQQGKQAMEKMTKIRSKVKGTQSETE